MSQIAAATLQLEMERFGAPSDPAILLIQGLGTPLTRWPLPLCQQLANAGYQVIRFDNRDIGLSSKLDHLGLPDLAGFLQGKTPLHPAYTLGDMAADGIALLDSLGIPGAHIVGASMGGMIAQHMVARHPQRCLSLTSMMSSSGAPDLPPPTPAALQALFSPLPSSRDEASIVADSILRQRILTSPAYPTPEPDLQRMFAAEYRRNFHPRGVLRQLAAMLADGDRRPLLTQILVPAMVLHGADDPLIPVACGRDTAAQIPGAELRVIPGMGHDFPLDLCPEFADAILSVAHRATGNPCNT